MPVDALSPIAVAVAVGILVANSGRLPPAAEPGLAFAAKRVLRFAVVLLGFRLALGDVVAAGGPAVVVVVVVATVTLVGTYALARAAGLGRQLAVLTGAGYAICGASAVAALREVVDAEDDDAAFAVALVTLFGTVAIVALPALAAWWELSATTFGRWVGASVHDVGQVVATAASGGDDALTVAVVVKLTRVLLLGPMLLAVGLWWRRRRPSSAASDQPGLVPWFVIGFLAAAVVRSLELLPDAALTAIGAAERWAFAVALVGLGAGVRVGRLRRVGARALVVGTLAWVLVALVAYVGVLLVDVSGSPSSTTSGA
jgi:uncharacterized integral membrane protein (TIGR00698 family)